MDDIQDVRNVPINTPCTVPAVADIDDLFICAQDPAIDGPGRQDAGKCRSKAALGSITSWSTSYRIDAI